jgi:Ca2+-binding RTX toxin-like protein
MRRVTLMLAAVATMVSLFAVVAYAAEIQGTDKADFLTESQRNDKIYGHSGPDSINAALEQPAETLQANDGDRDWVKGNKGSDNINVADGDDDDWVSGGKGNDTCTGDLGDNLDCELETQQ